MTGTMRIYLIEDDRSILRFVEDALAARSDFKLVGYSDTFAHAQRMAPHSRADVFLVDLGLPVTMDEADAALKISFERVFGGLEAAAPPL